MKISVLLGRIADEIIRFTQDNQGDLIIAGAHGQYHVSDYVLGTTSGDMVRQGNTPVLLIKKEPSFSYNSPYAPGRINQPYFLTPA